MLPNFLEWEIRPFRNAKYKIIELFAIYLCN